MQARKVAAQFTAYVWFENVRGTEASQEEKARFAKENWQPFMPVAARGLGRLLLKIAAGRSSKHRRPNQPCPLMAGA
jgi:hypothetical protein